MRVIAVAVILAVVALVRADDDGPKYMVDLTEEDFDTKALSGEPWVVDFYSPTCGFCKMIEPDLQQLAKEVLEDDLGLNVGKLNVREAREISQRYKIGKLPGLKLFRDGKVYTLPDARKTRTIDEYVEWAMESYEEIEQEELDRIAEEQRIQDEIDANSDVVKLTVDTFEEVASKGNWLIEFYGPKCGYCKKFAPTWELVGTAVAEQASTLDFKVAKFEASSGFQYTRQFKANPWPSIKFLKDGKVYTFPEPRNFDLEIQDYIDYATVGYTEQEDEPLVPEFLAARAKREARREKYKKMREEKAKKKAAEAAKKHDEL